MRLTIMPIVSPSKVTPTRTFTSISGYTPLGLAFAGACAPRTHNANASTGTGALATSLESSPANIRAGPAAPR